MITEEQAAGLLETFDAEPVIVGRNALIEAVAARLPGLGEEEPGDLVDALASLEVLRTSHGYSAADLADAVGAATNIELDDDARASLKARVDRLLGTSSLSATAKAYDLSWSQERKLLSARVITDVRPVFKDDPRVPPLGAIVVHTLELAFFRDATIESFYVALDEGDLQEVISVLTRAEEKAGGIKSFLASAGLPSFSAKNDNDGN